jgi:hypothetical protein
LKSEVASTQHLFPEHGEHEQPKDIKFKLMLIKKTLRFRFAMILPYGLILKPENM